MASRTKGRKLAAFYEAQNDHIGDLLKPLSAHTADGEQDVKDMALKVKLAVNISFFANCCLAALQLYAATTSGSLSLFATCADSGKLTRVMPDVVADLQSVSGFVYAEGLALILSRSPSKRYPVAGSSRIKQGRREEMASQRVTVSN